MSGKCGKCFATLQHDFPCANPECTVYIIYGVEIIVRVKDDYYRCNVDYRRKCIPVSRDPHVVHWTWVAPVQ